MKKMLNFT